MNLPVGFNEWVQVVVGANVDEPENSAEAHIDDENDGADAPKGVSIVGEVHGEAETDGFIREVSRFLVDGLVLVGNRDVGEVDFFALSFDHVDSD